MLINGIVSTISYSLSNLISVLEHLEPSWARAFLRRTRFMDPDFQGDVLAVICTFIFLSVFFLRILKKSFLFFVFLGTSYDRFLFAYGFTSSTNHALSASGSILTPISWPQRYSQRSWGGLWSSAIYDFWYSQERTISVRNFVLFFLKQVIFFILIKLFFLRE